jgi:hypothetical protein
MCVFAGVITVTCHTEDPRADYGKGDKGMTEMVMSLLAHTIASSLWKCWLPPFQHMD